MPAQKRKRPRGVVDTSVLVAGISGLKASETASKNPSAKLLRDWIESDTFVWPITDEIVAEYKRVLARLGVRRSLIGKIVNLLQEEAELVDVATMPNISPDPGDDSFCACAETGRADFVVTLNPKDFPQSLLSPHVINPTSGYLRLGVENNPGDPRVMVTRCGTLRLRLRQGSFRNNGMETARDDPNPLRGWGELGWETGIESHSERTFNNMQVSG